MSYGSCFQVDHNGESFFITCYHCICTNASEFRAGNQFCKLELNLVYVFPNIDLAVLKFSKTINGTYSPADCFALNTAIITAAQNSLTMNTVKYFAFGTRTTPNPETGRKDPNRLQVHYASLIYKGNAFAADPREALKAEHNGISDVTISMGGNNPLTFYQRGGTKWILGGWSGGALCDAQGRLLAMHIGGTGFVKDSLKFIPVPKIVEALDCYLATLP